MTKKDNIELLIILGIPLIAAVIRLGPALKQRQPMQVWRKAFYGISGYSVLLGFLLGVLLDLRGCVAGDLYEVPAFYALTLYELVLGTLLGLILATTCALYVFLRTRTEGPGPGTSAIGLEKSEIQGSSEGKHEVGNKSVED